MSKAVLFGSLILGVISAVAPLPALGIEPGAKAPGFSLPALNGGTISLAEQSGKVVYLDFWASWCGPCKETLPWMEQLKKKFEARGLRVIAVNLDSDAEAAKEALAGVNQSYAVALDPTMSAVSKYEPHAMPTSYLIDRSGSVTHVHSGFHEADRLVIETKISELLGN